jgi:hypothetical protein
VAIDTLGYRPTDISGVGIRSRNGDVMAKLFGEVPGNPIGSTFPSRPALSQAGVHRPRIGGISGNGREGADSIVVSGGYIDDEDFGDELIYTGHGGNDPATKRQIADQGARRSWQRWTSPKPTGWAPGACNPRRQW